jgi:hypothetical protein
MSWKFFKLSSVFFLTLLLLPISLKASSQNTNNNPAIDQKISQAKDKVPKEKEIKIDKLAKSSIKLLNDIVLNGDLNLAKKNNELETESLEALNKVVAKSQRKNSFLKKIKKPYKALKSEFVVKKFDVQNNVATIVLQEITEVTESKVDADQIIVPQYSKLHEFKFDVSEKSNKVKLIGYTALDDPEEISSKQPEEIQPIPLPENAVPAIVDIDGVNILNESEKSQKLKKLDTHKQDTSSFKVNKNPLLAQTYGPLNRPGMVAYASKWWNSFNPSYRNYTDGGGDCTNYASQILYEGGGLKFIKYDSSHDDTSAWWYNFNYSNPFGKKRQSNSWSNAVWFYSFMAAYPAIAKPVDRTSYLEIGDIVQVDFGGVGVVSHTMIVTEKRLSDSMIYLTGHTNPHFKLPVYDILTNPKNRLYTWKLVI